VQSYAHFLNWQAKIHFFFKKTFNNTPQKSTPPP